MPDICSHLDQIRDVTPQSPGCQDCLALGRRDWVHLRVCQTCGHVGCCDSSPGKHATAHFRMVGHPIVRSYEPGESWYWCYVDQVLFELEGAPMAPSHP
jgi:Zn-finger in ubiquitin-hydrolases and other protein